MAAPKEIPAIAGPLSIPLGQHGRVSLSSQDGRALVRIEAAGRQDLELSIEMGPAGPVIRARAAVLDVQAETIAVGCRQFSVDASESLQLRSGGDLIAQAAGQHQTTAHEVGVTATHGSVRLRANDDVQLLGEQLLLNCERPAPLPAWLPRLEGGPAVSAMVPLAAASGDASLLRDLEPPAREPSGDSH